MSSPSRARSKRMACPLTSCAARLNAFWRIRASNPLENGGDPLPCPDAHGRQAILRLAVLHEMNQRRGDARAAGAERVADGDGPAADVDLLRVGVEQLDDRQRLGGEGLVDLDQVDVFQ